jgi:hypothetical protein
VGCGSGGSGAERARAAVSGGARRTAAAQCGFEAGVLQIPREKRQDDDGLTTNPKAPPPREGEKAHGGGWWMTAAAQVR